MSHLTQDMLNLYLDGALASQERAAAEAHLAACAACRGELAALRALFAELDALPPEPLPADLAPLVLARLAPGAHTVRPTSRTRWSARAWALLAAQAALAAALAAWLAPAVSAWLPAWLAVLGLETTVSLAGLRAEAEIWLGALTALPADLLRAMAAFGGGPLAQLTPAMWALAIVGAAAVWLAGNRLLLARMRDA